MFIFASPLPVFVCSASGKLLSVSYNFRLSWRTFYHSFFRWKGTPARLNRKRLTFIPIFYFVWPIGGLLNWFFFFLDDILFSGYQIQAVEKPLFILGNLRIHSSLFFKPEEDENIHLQNWDGFLVSFLFPFMDELPNY